MVITDIDVDVGTGEVEAADATEVTMVGMEEMDMDAGEEEELMVGSETCTGRWEAATAVAVEKKRLMAW